jgi:hypothetical protein
VDDAGNAFVTGRTASADCPVRRAAQPRIRGRGCQGVPCHDAFVAKLGPNGGLVYSTFLGGTANEDGIGIAVDPAGSAYVSGNTESPDFPTRNAFQGGFQTPPCSGDLPCPPDSFAAKLTPSGGALVYSTYLGGRKSDTNGGITVDATGQAVVVGSTRSTDFPTVNALQPRIKGAGCGPPPVPCRDVYVTRLAPAGRPALFSTYLGGTKTEVSGGIAVDGDGEVYVTGSTGSPDFPTARPLEGAPGNSSCNLTTPVKELCDDAFVTKLGARGGRLVYSTFLGGKATDQGLGIAVTDAGAAVVTGRTDSVDFRVRDAVQRRLAGVSDAFLTRLSVGGTAAPFSTYLGGGEAERSNGVGLDDAGGAAIAGRTESPDYPTARAAQPRLAGDFDAFISRVR